MHATLFHTAHSHIDRFNQVRDRIAPDARLTHVVREDWLARAQTGIDATLRDEITQTITAAPLPAICTCTTIGPVAEAAGASRVDRPMMARAARIGGPILFAYCLESTLDPSLSLLKQVCHDDVPDLIMLDLGAYWPLFETGDADGFETAIADQITQATQDQQVACAILAQASMCGAANKVRCPVPVLSSPEQALSDLFLG